VPKDSTTDDLADVHANFRNWMNEQYHRKGKAWKYDPTFSSIAIKRLLRMAYLASLHTDELRFARGNLYVPPDQIPRDNIVLEPAQPLTTPKTITRLLQPLEDESALLIIERDGAIACNGIFYFHDLRAVFERLLPPREWIENRDGILVTVVRPGHIRLRQGLFDCSLEKETIISRREVTTVAPVKQRLHRIHDFLIKHHSGEKVDWSSLFIEDEPTWVEVFITRVLRAASKMAHGGTVVIVPEPHRAPLEVTYRARANAPTEVLDKLHGSWARAWRNTGGPGSADALISFERQRRLLFAQADALGRLTATDGCVVLDDSMRLHGFGGIIDVGRERLESSLPLMDPVMNVPMSEEEESKFFQKFGTRHRSACELCKACPHTIAFVMSQDGDLRIFCSDDSQVSFFDGLSA
jgi:hypothetical protein